MTRTEAAVPMGWDCHVHVFDAAAPVRSGHYVPAHRPLYAIEALAAQHGVGHLVLVQPSVYGSDNAVMLQALAAGHGRHRGVAVVEPGISERELDQMHAAGVRGVRFNLVSPAGQGGLSEALADLRQLSPRLRERGWFVQWYVAPTALSHVVVWQAQTGLPFVLDHMAGLHANLAADDPAWIEVSSLAQAGAWIKLSGWYRLQATEPYAALLPTVQRVAALFGTHTLWGSDWPHTSFAHDALPAYGSTLQPMRTALGETALAEVLQENPRNLFS